MPPKHQLLGKVADYKHGAKVIEPPYSLFNDAGELILYIDFLKEDFEDVRTFLPQIKFQNNIRLARVYSELGTGNAARLRTCDINFGFKPKRPIYGHSASCSRFNRLYPSYYQRLGELGQSLMSQFKATNPTKYAEQAAITSVIDPRWFIPQTFFTQAIINNAVSLEYHFDRGNFAKCWSCMAVFKNDIYGGDLIVPDLDLTIKIKDRCVLFFDGQALLHGVTPIVKKNTAAYRYSIVYYAIAAMKNCGTYEEEIEKIRDIEQRKVMARLRPE